MPDRDVFPGLHRSFRKVGRSIRALAPIDSVGNFGEKALSDLIRTDPCGDAFVDSLAAIAESGDPDVLQIVASSEQLKSSYLLRRLEETAKRAAPCDETLLLSATLRAIAADQFLTLRPELVREQGMSIGDANHYLKQCIENIQIRKLADSVARFGTNVKAPPRPRSSTSELLHKGLV